MTDIEMAKVQMLDARVNHTVLARYVGVIGENEARIICDGCLAEFRSMFPPHTKEWKGLMHRLDPKNPRDLLKFGSDIYRTHALERYLADMFMEGVLKNNRAEMTVTGTDSEGLFRFIGVTSTPDRILRVEGFPEWMVDFKYSSFSEAFIKLQHLQGYSIQARPTLVFIWVRGIGKFFVGPSLQAALRATDGHWCFVADRFDKPSAIININRMMATPMFIEEGKPMDITLPFPDLPPVAQP